MLQTDLIEFLNLLVPSQISWKSNNPIRFESKWLVGVCYTIPYVISWNPHENRGSRTFHKCGNVARHVALAMEPILPEHSTVGTETSCGKYESLESKFFPDFSQLFEESRVEFSKISAILENCANEPFLVFLVSLIDLDWITPWIQCKVQSVHENLQCSARFFFLVTKWAKKRIILDFGYIIESLWKVILYTERARK